MLGSGVSGRAAAVAASEAGIQVRVFDQQTSPPLLLPGAEEVPVTSDPDGAALASLVLDWDPQVVVASPGIPPHSSLLLALKDRQIWSEVQLAWALQQTSPSAGRPWLMVTGTNGKTTTVGILTSILRASGEDVAEVGNVGLPITSRARGPATVFAVEVSSFQLEYSDALMPQASVCLNVEEDHLDWHGTGAAYRAAKGKVYDGTRRARFYFDGDVGVASLAESAKRARESELVALGVEHVPHGGIGVDGDALIDATSGSPVRVANLRLVPFYVSQGAPAGLRQDIVAAAALSLAHGVGAQAIQRGLETYQPEAHRGAVVATVDSVRWVNNSKATNAHAALAALRGVPRGTAVWIAGGDGKGQDFKHLVSQAKESLRAVVVIGADREPLRRALYQHAPQTPIVEVAGDGPPSGWMEDVVRAASEHAQAGDTVLLAPACASWDQFRDYAERGDIFAAAVRDLSGGAGALGTAVQ